MRANVNVFTALTVFLFSLHGAIISYRTITLLSAIINSGIKKRLYTVSVRALWWY